MTRLQVTTLLQLGKRLRQHHREPVGRIVRDAPRRRRCELLIRGGKPKQIGKVFAFGALVNDRIELEMDLVDAIGDVNDERGVRPAPSRVLSG
ncbi:MAG: hypothetical protein QM784_29390 [Polyangiaceae bacterium]